MYKFNKLKSKSITIDCRASSYDFNSIASLLIEPPGYLQPIFMESNLSGKKNTIVEDWCYGYMRGVTLCLEDWDVEQLDMRILLSPILALEVSIALMRCQK